MTESGDGDLPLRVSTLELFFDLVFVFAITQLTRSGRSRGCSGWLTALTRHRRAAMSRRYQPPRSETVPASS